MSEQTAEVAAKTPEDNSVGYYVDPKTRRKQAVVAFAREHPLLVVAGGIAAGVLVGALLPKSAKIKRRASKLGNLIGAAAVSFGHEAAEKAEATGKTLRHGGHVVADRTEDLATLALRSASDFATSLADHVGKLSENAAGSAERFGEAAADRIGDVGRRASLRLEKVIPAAESAASTAGKRVSGALTDLRDKIGS